MRQGGVEMPVGGDWHTLHRKMRTLPMQKPNLTHRKLGEVLSLRVFCANFEPKILPVYCYFCAIYALFLQEKYH